MKEPLYTINSNDWFVAWCGWFFLVTSFNGRRRRNINVNEVMTDYKAEELGSNLVHFSTHMQQQNVCSATWPVWNTFIIHCHAKLRRGRRRTTVLLCQWKRKWLLEYNTRQEVEITGSMKSHHCKSNAPWRSTWYCAGQMEGLTLKFWKNNPSCCLRFKEVHLIRLYLKLRLETKTFSLLVVFFNEKWQVWWHLIFFLLPLCEQNLPVN